MKTEDMALIAVGALAFFPGIAHGTGLKNLTTPTVSPQVKASNIDPDKYALLGPTAEGLYAQLKAMKREYKRVSDPIVSTMRQYTYPNAYDLIEAGYTQKTVASAFAYQRARLTKVQQDYLPQIEALKQQIRGLV